MNDLLIGFGWGFAAGALTASLLLYVAVQGRTKSLIDLIAQQREEIRKLDIALKQARKNDTPRNPETGRFKKKK